MPSRHLIPLMVIASTLPVQAGQTEAFFDDFDRLDRKNWFISDGWSNGSHQNCTFRADHVSVRAGVLQLQLSSAADSQNDYACAEVQSWKRFRYGTFEARMRVPTVSGTAATAFTFIGPPQDQPHDEIDMEWIGKGRGALQTNYYTNGSGGNEALFSVFGASENFHNYAFEWRPGQIRWFVDGQLIREVEADDVPDQTQKLYFSLWSTGTLVSWLGPFQYPGAPFTLEVDWVSFTPLGAPCPTDGLLACKAPSP